LQRYDGKQDEHLFNSRLLFVQIGKTALCHAIVSPQLAFPRVYKSTIGVDFFVNRTLVPDVHLQVKDEFFFKKNK